MLLRLVIVLRDLDVVKLIYAEQRAEDKRLQVKVARETMPLQPDNAIPISLGAKDNRSSGNGSLSYREMLCKLNFMPRSL